MQSPKLDNVALRIQYLFKFVLIFTEGTPLTPRSLRILCILMVSVTEDLNVLLLPKKLKTICRAFFRHLGDTSSLCIALVCFDNL